MNERRRRLEEELDRFTSLQFTMLQILLHRARRTAPIVWTHKRSAEWWKVVVSTFSDEQWVQNFRMSKETFTYLCQRVQPAMEKQDVNYRLCVPLQQRVAIAVWKLATNADYWSIAHLFAVSLSTACKCLKAFCSAVEDILQPEAIQFPNADKLQEMANYFENRWGLPHCVGAIDGSHIPILAPQEYHTEYYNSKGWYSVVLQAVVDGKGLFWNVFSGLPGSMHDARVLRRSGLWNMADRLFGGQHHVTGGHDMGYYILGDAAYPQTSWLMKPFMDNGCLTEEETNFNIRLSRARVVVENAFGRLKGRWRCLLKRNDCNLDTVKSVVITCCVLHNLCESHGEDFREEWAEPVLFNQPDAPLQDGADTGVAARAALMSQLTN
uniref:DDE Tnp4 domain-containing protein n=1 Tax=Myripristis murdjan TaxID=586833 RepID=A0A668AUA2_9TELE